LVGFELTELIDQGFMARLSLMTRTQGHLNRSWRSDLSEAECAEFHRKYGNAQLLFVYRENTVLWQRMQIAVPALRSLLRLADNFEGISEPRELASVLDEIRIRRGTFHGPIFVVDSQGPLSDPAVTACLKKLAKNYRCDYPIQLLAYVEVDLMPPDEIWTAAIQALAKHISESQFERVWVFDRSSRSVRFKMPRS
jgi:hypothetical protein